MNPWEGYGAGDPMADPMNWASVNGQWQYVPRGGSAPPPYEGGGYYASNTTVSQPAPDYLEQGRQSAASESYIPPSGNIGSPATGQTLGLGTGQTDFATPLVPVYTPTGYSAPPAAPLISPEAAAVGGPVAAPQYQSGSSYSGGFAGGGGGYGSALAPMGNPMLGDPMMMPSGEPFGAPKQMAPDGSFDPFLWSGTQNPMPPPSATRAMILQEMGLLNPLTQAPPGPTMQYVAAKLGLELPNALPTGASLATSARPMEQAPPAAMPAVPQAPAAPAQRGNYPPLPPMPLPNRGY